MTVIELRTPVELVPVVDLSPGLLDESRDEPPEWARKLADPQHAWWRRLMAELGLGHLHGLGHSTLVPVRLLRSPRDLRVILSRFFEHNIQSPAQLDPDDPIALDGGFALLSEGEVRVIPQCCSDLSDLEDWREAVETRAGEWEELWIGHPWICTRFQGDRMQVSNYCDEDTPPSALYSVDIEDITAAIDAAEFELESFYERLLHSVAEFFDSQDPVLVADMLTGRAP